MGCWVMSLGPSVLIQHVQPMSNSGHPSREQIGKRNINSACPGSILRTGHKSGLSQNRHGVYVITGRTPFWAHYTSPISLHEAEQHLIPSCCSIRESSMRLDKVPNRRSQITFHLARARCCALEPQTET